MELIMSMISKMGNNVISLRFFEPNGCYYSNDFEPKGWWVLDVDGQEHFYDY